MPDRLVPLGLGLFGAGFHCVVIRQPDKPASDKFARVWWCIVRVLAVGRDGGVCGIEGAVVKLAQLMRQKPSARIAAHVRHAIARQRHGETVANHAGQGGAQIVRWFGHGHCLTIKSSGIGGMFDFRTPDICFMKKATPALAH